MERSYRDAVVITLRRRPGKAGRRPSDVSKIKTTGEPFWEIDFSSDSTILLDMQYSHAKKQLGQSDRLFDVVLGWKRS